MHNLYLGAQTMVFTFFVMTLLGLWFRDPDTAQKRRLRELLPDSAIIWFAVAVACWAVTGALILLVGEDGVERLLIVGSVPNTLCFLLALRSFRYAPTFVSAEGMNARTWIVVVSSVVGLDLLVSVLLYFTSHHNARIYLLPDLILNLTVVALLTLTFAISARSRGYSGLLVVTVLGGAALIFGQLSYVIWSFHSTPDWVFALRLMGKIGFLITFLAIVVTWAVEEGERAIDAKLLHLYFTGEVGTARYPCIVKWRIRDQEVRCRMAVKASEQLLRLVVDRITNGEKAQLNISRDLRTDRGGLEGISDQLRLRFQDIIELVRDSEFSGMYRLKMQPQNLHVDSEAIARAHPVLEGIVRQLITPKAS